MLDFSGITEGFANLIKDKLGLLSEEIQLIALERSKICCSCPIFNSETNRCDKTKSLIIDGKEIKGCGCYLPAKVKCINSVKCTCPANKWKSLQ
ncbi:MAG TPA: hypothetical protein VIK84_02635 [Haloplasmataceae bacterium]